MVVSITRFIKSESYIMRFIFLKDGCSLCGNGLERHKGRTREDRLEGPVV